MSSISPQTPTVQASLPSHTRVQSNQSNLIRELAINFLLVFITIIGVLVRIGLEFIGTYSDSNVFNLIYSQIVGCLIMGFILNRKAQIESFYPPIYTMLGTGLCGSITTFSSYMFDVFAGFANLNQPQFNRFNGFMNGWSVTIITIGMSLISLQFGKSLSELIRTYSNSNEERVEETKRIPRAYDMLAIMIGVLSYLAVVLMIIFLRESYDYILFSILLGPAGTLTRFHLGKRLNSYNKAIPFGTLTANLLACILYGIIYVLQSSVSTAQSGRNSAILYAVQNGFCGSLSTISTFVVELSSLSRSESYRYFSMTYLLGLAFYIIIIGSFSWRM